MKSEPDHPCLTCPLPDCDDRSSRCPLRKALSAYTRARHQKRISAEIRRGYAIAFREFYHSGRARRGRA